MTTSSEPKRRPGRPRGLGFVRTTISTPNGPVVVSSMEKIKLIPFDATNVVAVMKEAVKAYTPPTREPTIREKLTHPDVMDVIIEAVEKGMPIRTIQRALKAGGVSVSEASLRNYLPEILNYPVDQAAPDETAA